MKKFTLYLGLNDKIHNIELWNEDFAEWCNGRILKRDEK